MGLDVIGWVATVMIVVSFFIGTTYLRGVQATAAVLWAVYGVTISSTPIVAANVLICCAAVISMVREKRHRKVER